VRRHLARRPWRHAHRHRPRTLRIGHKALGHIPNSSFRPLATTGKLK
jgi:hypothetical protein